MVDKIAWPHVRLGNLITLKNGDYLPVELTCVDGTVPVYGGGDIKGYTSNSNCEPDTVIISRQGATCGTVRQVSSPFWATEHAMIVGIKYDGLLPRWGFYAMSNLNLGRLSMAAAQPGISQEKVKSQRIYLPPVDEQRRIADFLDEKCAQIDRAITSAEQSIQEYKAYQEATIVEQFRSAAARRVKLPYFADSVLGKMLDQAQQRGVNVHPYLANRDVQWFRLNVENLAEMDFPEDSYDRYGIKDGDILVCEGGEVGKCAVFRGETPGIYFQKAVHRIRVNQELAYPEFIAYQMFAKAKTGNFMEVRKGQATFNHLPGEQLRQLRFVLPPLEEQRRIAGFLDEKCAQIDRAVEAKQAIIDELKSYKKSLIYEVVTGKREV